MQQRNVGKLGTTGRNETNPTQKGLVFPSGEAAGSNQVHLHAEDW